MSSAPSDPPFLRLHPGNVEPPSPGTLFSRSQQRTTESGSDTVTKAKRKSTQRPSANAGNANGAPSADIIALSSEQSIVADADQVVADLWQAFTAATGWKLGSDQRIVMASPPKGRRRAEPACGHDTAAELAEKIFALIDQLEDSVVQIQRQNADIAAQYAGMAMMPAADQLRLSDQLRILLCDAATATGCDAAALYLLDEDTSELSVRAIHNLPQDRLSRPPQPLRGSLADLEAMVAEIVCLDDLRGPVGQRWCSPEPFPSAMCVAVRLGDFPIGTLWLWNQESTTHNENQQSTAKLAASSIASELVRHDLQRRHSDSGQLKREVQSVAQHQLRSLPPAAEIAPGWQVD
ncbi:MAG: GAF domain-containing protein, partial [Planctomycetota bacterium]